MKPYYEQEGITIYHGDCREIFPTLPPVGLVLTDPPYGINHPTDYKDRGRGGFADCRNYPPVHGDSEAFDPTLWIEQPAILFGANYFADKLPPTSGWLVWDKQRPDELDQSTCELAWSNCVKGVRRIAYLWNGAIRQGDQQLQHPTEKPIAVMKWCLSLRWTRGFQLILDPFMGSGTTLRAAKDLGRQAIGIEIEERYCEIAANRLRQQVFDFEPADTPSNLGNMPPGEPPNSHDGREA